MGRGAFAPRPIFFLPDPEESRPGAACAQSLARPPAASSAFRRRSRYQQA